MKKFQLKQTNEELQNDLDLTENLQDAFDPAKTYEVGDLVIYDGKLYQCKIAIVVADEWDSTKWEIVHLNDLLDTINTLVASHISNNSNPHSVTKTQVGLSNVDNTSDLDKPISTATQTALDTKQDSIEDLDSIRSGAALGVTALQSVPAEYITETELNNYHDSTKADINSLATVATSGSYTDLSDKPSIPDAVVANSSDTASATLNKLKVGETTYSLPQDTSKLYKHSFYVSNVTWSDGSTRNLFISFLSKSSTQWYMSSYTYGAGSIAYALTNGRALQGADKPIFITDDSGQYAVAGMGYRYTYLASFTVILIGQSSPQLVGVSFTSNSTINNYQVYEI